MVDPIPDAFKAPREPQELFVVELDERLEFGVAMVDDTDIGTNFFCSNSAFCSGTDYNCWNGFACGS